MAFRKIKNILSVAFAALGLFSCIAVAACANADEKIKITVGMWQGTSASEKAYFEECKRAFEEKYPRYEILSSPYVYDADTVVAKYASGQLPVLFEADASLVRSALGNGFIKDVSPYLRAFGWLDKANDYFLSEISVGEMVCGVPAEQNFSGMVLNLPLLYEAGVIGRDGDGKYILYAEDGSALYPDTFEEVEEAARKVVRATDGASFGVFLSSNDAASGEMFLDIVYNFGSTALEYVDDDGNWKLSLTHGEFGDAMRWVRQMSQERYIDDSRAYGAEEWASVMAENGAAIAFCRSDSLAAALAAEPLLDGNIAFVPMPAAENVPSCSVWGGTVYAFSAAASDEQTEGAFLLLRFMGCGPDTDEQSVASLDGKFREYSAQGAVFPVISVWQDAAYTETLHDLYEKYETVEREYIFEFYAGAEKRRRSGEPYACAELCTLLDELFSKMLFEATTSNVVTLTEEGERAFTEKYLGPQASGSRRAQDPFA